MKNKWIIIPASMLLLTGCAQEQNNTTEPEQSNEQTNEQTETATNEFGQSESGTTESSNQEETLTPEEQKHAALIEALPEDASSTDWNLILVNRENPLPEGYETNLVEVEPQKEIDERIVEPFQNWVAAAKEAGHQLYFASGYRSVERQQNNYDRSVNNYMKEGYSEAEAIEKTEEYIAVPRSSEHHTGLAIDVVDQEWIASGKGLIPEYDTQPSQHWLEETMADYGFILRYPEGTSDLTGINYESWHFRYVGKENAQYIVEQGLVLEQYIELLKERETSTQE